MNKQQLIDAIRQRMNGGISKQHIEQVLDTLGDVATFELSVASMEIPLPGLGKLVSEHVAGRTGRNPKTGEPLEIPARTVAKFRPGKALKDAIA